MLFQFRSGYNGTTYAKTFLKIMQRIQIVNWLADGGSKCFRMVTIAEWKIHRKVVLDSDLLKATLANNPTVPTRKLGFKLSVSHLTIQRHLKKLGTVPKLRKCVPHELSATNNQHRLDICAPLHSGQNCNQGWEMDSLQQFQM